MTIFLRWWSRNKDFSPDYNKEYHENIFGASAAECMRRIREMKYNHDCAKYTPIEIVNVAD